MSGRERSSIKWNLPCAERVPGSSLCFEGNVRGMSSRSYARFFADVAELADAIDLGSIVNRRAGSIPVIRIFYADSLFFLNLCNFSPHKTPFGCDLQRLLTEFFIIKYIYRRTFTIRGVSPPSSSAFTI